MKTKKLISVLTLFIVSLSAVLALGFLHNKVVDVKAATSEATQLDEKTSAWLLLQQEEGYAAVKTEVNAGTTSGYGKFELNKLDVTLETTANTGFKLVGWNVTYTTGEELDNSTTIFLHNSENLQQTTYEIETESFNEQTVKLTMDYADLNGDGYFDFGSFKISNIFSNMTVDAVFDYIYYDLDTTEIFDLIKTNNQKDNLVYYETSSVAEATLVETFVNAFLKRGNRVLFYKTLNYDSAKEQFFTINNIAGEEQRIDVERGAYKLDETINYTFKINAKQDVLDEGSVNVDVRSVSVLSDNIATLLLDGAEDEFAKIVKDDYLRTSQVQISLKVKPTKTHKQILTFEYHNLFVASINIIVDGGTNLSSDENYYNQSKEIILKFINLSYYYSQISSTQFFVKNNNQNENSQTFEVFCNLNVYGETTNYLFYIFEKLSLTGNVNNQKNYVDNNVLRYDEVIDNFGVDVEYSSAKYSIDFQPYLIVNDNSLIKIVDESFKVNKTLENLIRGSVINCSEIEVEKNVGYSFFGFATNLDNALTQPTTQIEIDSTKPTNRTLLLLFKNVEYSLQISKLNTISLFNSGKEIYPVKNLSVKLNNFEIENSNEESLLNSVEKNVKKIQGSFKLNDKITINLTTNIGFEIGKIFIDENDVYSSTNLNLEFSITQDFITTIFADYYSNQTIDVKLIEKYRYNTLTYFIEPTFDNSLKKTIVMADISAELEKESQAKIFYKYNDSDEEYNSPILDRPVETIIVKNLKLYEKVTLNSTSRTYQSELGDVDYKYQFVRFTKDNKNSLTFLQADDNYYYTATINEENISIKVVYAPKVAILSITTNKPDAFEGSSFSNYVKVYCNDIEQTINADNQVEISAGELKFVIVDGENAFNFGYKLTQYILTDVNLRTQIKDATNVQNPYSVSFTISGNEEAYSLEIHLETILFQIGITQYGNSYLSATETKTYQDEKYTFEGGKYYTTLSVESGLTLSFNLPEGAYVDKFSFVHDGEMSEVEKFKQTNLNQEKIYSYEFSLDDVKNYLIPYGYDWGDEYTIIVAVEYKLHTYAIDAEYIFINSKNSYLDSKIVFPNVVLAYQLDGQNYQIVSQNNTKVLGFENIPYGVSPTLSLASALPIGYTSSDGWGRSNTTSKFVYDANKIVLTKIVTNESLIYSIEYQAYRVNLKIDGEKVMGNPQANKQYVSLFDELVIEMNAYKNLGYKFKQMYYFSNYNFGEAGWDEYKDRAFVYFEGNFVKANLEFDINTTYYIQNLYSQSNVFVDEEINLNNYTIIDDCLNFYIQYDYIQVEIVNTSMDLFIQDEYENNLSALNILPENYAQYQIYKRVNSGWVLLENSERVTVEDSIRITIKINSVQLENDIYDLARGLSLIDVSYNLEIGQEENFYVVRFNMKDVIENVSAEDKLNIDYTYVIDEKNVSLTTNINNSSFYYFENEIRFLMSYKGISPFTNAGDSSYATNLVSEMQFLSVAEFSYQFVSKNYDYFEITKIIVKHNNEIVPEEEYANFGVQIKLLENSFTIRFLDDLEIILQVEPILQFYDVPVYGNGASTPLTPDEFGNFTFTNLFYCDENLDAKNQTLTKGSSNRFNIVSAQIVLDSMQINYYNLSGVKEDPKNVGVYQVVISFNNVSNYEWFNEINLNYKIYLQITPLPITISYNNDFYDNEDYFGGSEIQFSRVADSLIIKDNLGGGYLYINYDENSKIQFENSAQCFITQTDKNEGVENLYKDTASDLNLTVVGLKLLNSEFCKNFVIQFGENVLNLNGERVTNILVIEKRFTINKRQLTILGINVYDKVYDGTTEADYDVVNWSFGQNLIAQDYGLVGVDFAKFSLQYETSEVGVNKKIVANTNGALINVDASVDRAQNYYLVVDDYYKSIYRYSVSTYLPSVGEITVYNERGKINKADPNKTYRQYVNLIPFDAELNVKVIYENSNEYRQIYAQISNYLSNEFNFAIGYQINFKVGDFVNKINNNLFLKLPSVKRLSSAIWLSNTSSGKLKYSEEKNFVNLDLNDTNEDFVGIVFIQYRQYLTWWQITLIILLILLILLILILIFIHERRKKQKRDILNEKI